MFQGIDVSGWQGRIDWDAVAADEQGIGFALIRATEGGHIIEKNSRGYIDREFKRNWENASNAGLTVGPYHIGRVSDQTGIGGYELVMDARSEASWFATVLREIGWDTMRHIPPVLELRWDKRAKAAGITPAETLRWAMEFLSTMNTLCGCKPMIYARPSFWRQMLLRDTRLQEFPLWECDTNHPAGAPRTLADWTWLFHQYSFKGRVRGIAGNVGMDVFRGTKQDFIRFIEIGALPEEGPYPGAAASGELGLPQLEFSGTSQLRGKAVERLQGMLMSHGYGPEGLVSEDGLPSGIGGPATRDAVGRFQLDVGLLQDYEVGPLTWRALLFRGIPPQ